MARRVSGLGTCSVRGVEGKDTENDGREGGEHDVRLSAEEGVHVEGKT